MIKHARREEAFAVVTTRIVPRVISAVEACIVRWTGVSAAQMGHPVSQVSEIYLS